MRRTKHFGKMWFINNHIVIANCRGRNRAQCNLDYSMIRAGIDQCPVPVLPFQKEEILTAKLLQKDKSKSTQIFSKRRSDFKIVGFTTVTRSRFCTDYPQVFGITV